MNDGRLSEFVCQPITGKASFDYYNASSLDICGMLRLHAFRPRICYDSLLSLSSPYSLLNVSLLDVYI